MNIGNVKGKVVAIEEGYFTFRPQVQAFSELPTKVVVPKLFATSIKECATGNRVALIDVTVDYIAGHLIPQLVIIEPDYLLDVSSVAECMREYGSHPFYFLINRCSDRPNTAPILLGNAANFFLDTLIYADDIERVDVNACIKKFFQLYPIDISSCKDLRERSTELQFFESLKLHFSHLKTIVQKTFKEKGIDRKSVILEPSFICPNLGIQGRLDLFEQKEKETSSVIELKSGKTPFGDSTNQAIGLNHQTQASLYQMMIQQVMGMAFSKLETYICYSRCGQEENPLRLAHPSMALIAEALNVRNHIALNDYKVAFGDLDAGKMFASIFPERMIKGDHLDSKLIRQYIVPYIEDFSKKIAASSELERAYFLTFYQFLVKEQWLGKSGTAENQERSLASLWALDAASKKEAGMLLDELRIVHKEIQYEYTVVTFSYQTNMEVVADFREGDIVVLYRKMNDSDNATMHQVFKGSILSLGEAQIILRLRNHQQEKALPTHYKYAIEHDVLDNNYTSQFRGLYKFLSATQERKDLVLGLRKPSVKEKKLSGNIDSYLPEIQSLLKKINNVEDMFLLVGPPGTGKTSIALKSIVAYNYTETENRILLSAYTNRAVDEICAAIETISHNVDYVRLGSHVNCPVVYQKKLLSEQIKNCSNRREVQTFIQEKRIFVGTVAALSANTELLSNKRFDLAIVDEASQILDPQILNLLCTKSGKEYFSIGKFILIGDHKQLPAVCLQESEASENPLLLEKSISSGKISFFERMLRLYEKDENIVMQLDKQGRMHPEVAAFANKHFYSSSLKMIPLPHQTAELHWITDNYIGHKQILSLHRTHYFPLKDMHANGAKNEAGLTANLVKMIIELYQEHDMDFHAQYSLGVITPFRSQIALIRRSLRKLNIPILNRIVVDTVERYQGSQKDIIIYAFGVYSSKQLQQVTDAITVCDEVVIDRKLNVALTRARKQFFFVGSEYWAMQNELYRKLIQYLRNAD